MIENSADPDHMSQSEEYMYVSHLDLTIRIT